MQNKGVCILKSLIDILAKNMFWLKIWCTIRVKIAIIRPIKVLPYDICSGIIND